MSATTYQAGEIHKRLQFHRKFNALSKLIYMWSYTLIPIPYLQCNKCPALFLKSYQKSLSLSRRWSLNHQRPHLCPFCLLYFPCFHLFVIFCLFSFCLLCLFFVALLIGWVSESVMFSFLAITSTEIYTLVCLFKSIIFFSFFLAVFFLLEDHSYHMSQESQVSLVALCMQIYEIYPQSTMQCKINPNLNILEWKCSSAHALENGTRCKANLFESDTLINDVNIPLPNIYWKEFQNSITQMFWLLHGSIRP